MKLTAIIMFLIPVVVARHNHRTLLETILKSKGNVYSKVDDDVQSVMNNLFDSLNLAPDFPSRSRIKLLLTMHYDLKSIAEKNFEAHDRMLDAAEVSIDNNTATGIALITIIGDILDNKPFNLSSTLYGKYVPRKRTKHKKESHVPRAVTTTSTTTETILETTTSQPVFADSKEFVEFIHDFIKKIDQLSENDFSKPVAGEPVAMPVSPEEDDDDNLEYWEPPPVLELDFVNDTNSRRIFKGKRSRVKSYPFMVSIHLMGTFTCAGSILTRDLVISAASCLQLLHNNRFYRENPSALTVRVGSDFFARGGEIIPVVETYFHPGYDPKTLANNLVMLRLYKHIRFLRKERKVKRIRFDRTPANLATNTENIIVIGWGARKKSNVIDQFERMLVAKLDIYQVNECAEIYSPTFVTDKNFCAGFISNGGGACNKDVGGPGVVGGTLIGVISFGAPVCGAIDSPTVFTKLGYYGKWIDSVIRTRSGIKPIGVRTTPQPPPRIWTMFTQTTEPILVPIQPTPATKNKVFALKQARIEPMLTDIDSLPDIMYGDLPEEDVFEMFTTSTKTMKPLQHPLANKSIFLYQGCIFR
ncbi:serine protease Hayan-like isoform X1 [Spodoptera frugiperda]|uniref:Serine protease Hayan-like isoform X1 n=1 Tax=Spodoptera frugiperda TaxID=7108 RepID=A0A9R0EQZ4_SPOFR|nr:serine protease Hayan-like isoform X1 [Spodoptera frugiperda]